MASDNESKELWKKKAEKNYRAKACARRLCSFLVLVRFNRERVFQQRERKRVAAPVPVDSLWGRAGFRLRVVFRRILPVPGPRRRRVRQAAADDRAALYRGIIDPRIRQPGTKCAGAA